MSFGLVQAAYVTASILFILALGGLSNQEKAKRAIWYGIIGMGIAVFATVFGQQVTSYWFLIPMIAIGAVIGTMVAQRVEMTGMPELVAILHSFVGLAAVFIGINSAINPPAELQAAMMMQEMAGAGAAQLGAISGALGLQMQEVMTASAHMGAEVVIHQIEVFIGVFIGAITFTGSIIAYGKLSGKMDGGALILPNRHLMNIAGVTVSFILLILFLNGAGIWTLLLMALIAFAIGAHLVIAIGGADMPVVVSMLNSYSGWAAAATGFMLGNDLLIVTGALVGSSGAILSYIMCVAMNRKFLAVILGGFGGPTGPAMEIEGEQVAIDADGVAAALNEADSVVVIPGYGMAVAQAQQSVSELTNRLRAAGKNVRFGIHPVAGRLPGHMNVLLAEAKVPYDYVLEMDEINDDFPETDVVIIIGSNDIVNPAAQDDPNSPIAGMPVLEVWKAKQVFVSKRGQGTGYSGIENPLFFKENTRMFFGDAKDSMNALLQRLS